MRILVTGGAGFIGSNLVRALAQAEHEVVVLDNLVTMHSLKLLEDVLDRVRFCHGDIRAREDLERLPSGPYDRVYHLAASFANELSTEHPQLDMRTNIEGTLHVLDFARRAGCGLFVYTGSSSSYGDAPTPFHEDGPLRPSTPYAMSKQVGEMYVQASGLSHAVLRLFNVYGPGDPPGRYRNAIPNMIRALDRPDGCLRVYGREATRDFTYVDDVVRALCEAPRAAGQVLNVGTGTETPILKLAHRLLEHFRLSEACLSIEPPRPWDRVLRRCAHVGRLRSLYQWVPSTPLDDGLVRTMRWMHAAGYLTRSLV